MVFMSQQLLPTKKSSSVNDFLRQGTNPRLWDVLTQWGNQWMGKWITDSANSYWDPKKYQGFTQIAASVPFNNSLRKVLKSSPFHRWGSWGSGKLGGAIQESQINLPSERIGTRVSSPVLLLCMLPSLILWFGEIGSYLVRMIITGRSTWLTLHLSSWLSSVFPDSGTAVWTAVPEPPSSFTERLSSEAWAERFLAPPPGTSHFYLSSSAHNCAVTGSQLLNTVWFYIYFNLSKSIPNYYFISYWQHPCVDQKGSCHYFPFSGQVAWSLPLESFSKCMKESGLAPNGLTPESNTLLKTVPPAPIQPEPSPTSVCRKIGAKGWAMALFGEVETEKSGGFWQSRAQMPVRLLTSWHIPAIDNLLSPENIK